MFKKFRKTIFKVLTAFKLKSFRRRSITTLKKTMTGKNFCHAWIINKTSQKDISRKLREENFKAI